MIDGYIRLNVICQCNRLGIPLASLRQHLPMDRYAVQTNHWTIAGFKWLTHVQLASHVLGEVAHI